MAYYITFSAVRCNRALSLAIVDGVLELNGDVLDVSILADGDALPAGAVDSPFVVGPITREGDDYHLTLMLPHGANAPEDRRFPAPIVATADGNISLPNTEVSDADNT